MPVTSQHFGLTSFAFPLVGQEICDFPATGDVRNGVVYSEGALTGTLTLPSENDVRYGTSYGELGTEFTGTLIIPGGGTVPSGPHSPADIIRWMLVAANILGYPGTDPYPGYATDEPDRPDDCVTVYNTSGRDFGRYQIDGDREEHPGIQVRIRSTDNPLGYAKAVEIRDYLNKQTYKKHVTIGAWQYCVHSVSMLGTIMDSGADTPRTKRRIFFMNGTTKIVQLFP